MEEHDTFAAAKDSTPGGSEIDTFDNPTEVKEVVSKEAKDTESLEVQTDEKDKAEKVESKENKKEEKEEEKKEEQKQEKYSIPKKSIKAVNGEDTYELDPKMELRLKNGDKFEMVSIADIRDNYSEAMQIIENQKNYHAEQTKFKNEYESYKKERDEIGDHFTKIGQLLDAEDGNPLDALNYLLDLTGRNRYEFSKKILDKQLEELDMLQGMDQVERAKYFLEKENAYLKEKAEISRTSMKTKIEDEKFVNEITRKREAAGVSEEVFVEAYSDLEQMGEKNITPERIIQYAICLPAVIRAETLMKKIDSDLVEDDELILQLSGYLKDNPNVADNEIMEMIENELGIKREIKKLNKKVDYQSRGNSADTPRQSNELESFDDFNSI